jgi:hypothetical protein
MKNILGSVLAAGIAVALPASATAAQPAASGQADDAAKLIESRAIIAIIFPASEREAMFTKLQGDIVAQMGALIPASLTADPGLKAIVDEFKNEALGRQRAVLLKHLPLQLDAMADAYAREFSLAELKDIHAFAVTPPGGHYLSKSVTLIGDPAVAKANRDTIADVHAVTQELIPSFKDKAIAYLKAHPEVAKKLAADDKGN